MVTEHEPPEWYEPVAILPEGSSFHRISTLRKDEGRVSAACHIINRHHDLEIVSREHAESDHNASPCPHCWDLEGGTQAPRPTPRAPDVELRKYLSGKNHNVAKRIKYREAQGRCEVCLRAESRSELVLHHIVPIYSGGTHDQWNLMILCESCHGGVESYTSDLFEDHIPRREVIDFRHYDPPDDTT